jgi:DNA-binding transcriptional MerR regulator
VRIGELATMTGTTVRALRYYEQAGLIVSERAHNGYRIYVESVAVRVRNIRYLLAAGLTLDDVQAFRVCLDGDVATAPPSAEGVLIAAKRSAVIDHRLTAQAEIRDRLAGACSGLRPTAADRWPDRLVPARPHGSGASVPSAAMWLKICSIMARTWGSSTV